MPYLHKSRQTWKVLFGWGVMPVIALGMVAAGVTGRLGHDPETSTLLYATALAIGAGGLLWAVWSVRCRVCRARLLLKAIREKDPAGWWPWLSSLVACPVCGDEGRSDDNTS